MKLYFWRLKVKKIPSEIELLAQLKWWIDIWISLNNHAWGTLHDVFLVRCDTRHDAMTDSILSIARRRSTGWLKIIWNRVRLPRWLMCENRKTQLALCAAIAGVTNADVTNFELRGDCRFHKFRCNNVFCNTTQCYNCIVIFGWVTRRPPDHETSWNFYSNFELLFQNEKIWNLENLCRLENNEHARLEFRKLTRLDFPIGILNLENLRVWIFRLIAFWNFATGTERCWLWIRIPDE